MYVLELALLLHYNRKFNHIISKKKHWRKMLMILQVWLLK